ncbi:hypothetical protein [Spongiibacter sp. UBA1325]|uniref:hypothetical protein n=1 Tax=Spongiibacter sp. UBA1325 TaxID=1947543 RepID=UPI00257ECAD6|nr:hypothetical protein [Spongiibacter sp. UBA1325]|tara:strand:- start:5998 stop:6366 length:369 start_codon:yes stop_codon:yes gene_type:complete
MKPTINLSAWGQTPPHFITVLANEVQESNQATVARRLGVSRTAISLLLRNKYPTPSHANMESRILSTLGAVHCPKLGEISQAECQKHRNAKFIGSNPSRIALYRACQTCPNNQRPTRNGVKA